MTPLKTTIAAMAATTALAIPVITASAFAATIALSVPPQPNQTVVSFNVLSSTCSAPIAIPITDKPVMLYGVDAQHADAGAGQMALQRNDKVNPAVLTWSGTDAFSSTVEKGNSSVVGTHMVWLDNSGLVDVQIAAGGRIQVCNGVNPTAKGSLNLVY